MNERFVQVEDKRGLGGFLGRQKEGCLGRFKPLNVMILIQVSYLLDTATIKKPHLLFEHNPQNHVLDVLLVLLLRLLRGCRVRICPVALRCCPA